MDGSASFPGRTPLVTIRTIRWKRALSRLCLLTALLLQCACNARREYEAGLVLADIAAGAGPSRLKSLTTPPKRRTISFFNARGKFSGDLYLGEKAPLAGILLLPGAAEQGKDDPRLQVFAMSLARARFAVFVPDLIGFRSLQVGSRDIVDTSDAFAWFASRSDLAPGGRVGIFTFSYASGPAILAALVPTVGERVRFLMAVGGYYSLKDVLVFFTTGYFREGGQWRHREPNAYGKWVLVSSNVERISDVKDRLLFQEIIRRKLADLNAPVFDLAAHLGPEGRSLYDFIDNRDLSKALPLMKRLPLSIRREIEALDVAGYDLSGLKARLILVHGYDDDIIPYTESVALAHNVPKGLARLYLVHGLKHVTLELEKVPDIYRLWRAISRLLRERESL